VTPFEQIRVVATHEGNLFRSFLLTLADQLPFLQHYRLKCLLRPVNYFAILTHKLSGRSLTQNVPISSLERKLCRKER
jgi:hypothetical protein